MDFGYWGFGSYPQVASSFLLYNQYNMKNSKKLVILSILVLSLSYIPGLAFAVQIENPLKANNFGELLLSIAGAAGALIASLGTIMIIVAGILYLLSAGSQERMTKAKSALVYAIVGIVIGLAATAIVEVIKGLLGV